MLKKKRKEELRMQREQELYLAKLRHDIRSPLGAIIGMVQIGELQLDRGEDLHDTLAKIELAANQIEMILDRSRAEGKGRNTEEDVLSKRLDGIRILLAEDSALAREVMKDLLEKAGAQVHAVADGIQMVEHFRQQSEGKYHMILTDIRMPGLDGMEATKTIRALPRKDVESIPIVALTGDEDGADRLGCKLAGVTEYLMKPIQIDDLCRILNRN